MSRIGYTEKRLRQLNPRLIYCSITGFGAEGPYRNRPAYDAVALALSGLSSLQVDPHEPRVTGPTLADNLTGQVAAFAIAAALLERERTGHARRVEINMLEAVLAFFPDAFTCLDQLGQVADPYRRARASQSYVFRCGDGRLLSVHLSSRDKFWEGFTRALGRDEMARDERFLTRALRIEHYEALVARAAPYFLSRDRAFWLARLEANDVPAAPVNRVDEVQDDDQVRHLNSFFEVAHPSQGPQQAIRRPIHLDGGRDDQPVNAAPLLDEHREQILRELRG